MGINFCCKGRGIVVYYILMNIDRFIEICICVLSFKKNYIFIFFDVLEMICFWLYIFLMKDYK